MTGSKRLRAITPANVLFQRAPGRTIPQKGQAGSSLLISLRQFGQSIDFFSIMAESRPTASLFLKAVQKLVPYRIRDVQMQGPRWFDRLTMTGK
jgi:hypothetical protein